MFIDLDVYNDYICKFLCVYHDTCHLISKLSLECEMKLKATIDLKSTYIQYAIFYKL